MGPSIFFFYCCAYQLIRIIKHISSALNDVAIVLLLCMDITLIAGHMTSWVALFAISLVILGHLQYPVS